MPHRSKAQQTALAAGRLRSHGQNPTVAEQLESTKAELQAAKSTLAKFQFTQNKLVSSAEEYKTLYKSLRNECRKVQRVAYFKGCNLQKWSS